MKCAVFNCKSDNKCKKSDISFYSFPKDKALLKKWVHFCHRNGKFNIKTARICNKHFTPDDVENNTQFEMGFCTKKVLKPGCVPSVNENSEFSAISKERLSRIQVRNNKKLVATLLQESKPDEYEEALISSLQQDLDQSGDPLCIPKIEPCEYSDEDEFLLEDNTPAQHSLQIQENVVKEEVAQISLPEIVIEPIVPEELQCHVQGADVICPYVERARTLKTDVDELRLKKFLLEQSAKEHIEEISLLKKRLEKVERDKNNLEANLRGIFTAGQVDKLKNGMKRKVWSDEEIGQALTLYATSKKAYKMLFKQNFPIPAIRTIQKFLQTRNDSTEVLEEFTDDEFSDTAIQIEDVQREHSYFSSIEISRVDDTELIEKDNTSLLTPLPL